MTDFPSNQMLLDTCLERPITTLTKYDAVPYKGYLL